MGGERYWRSNTKHNNNPTPCQLAVVNKFDIQNNKTPIPIIDIFAQLYGNYAERIKDISKVIQVQNA